MMMDGDRFLRFHMNFILYLFFGFLLYCVQVPWLFSQTKRVVLKTEDKALLFEDEYKVQYEDWVKYMFPAFVSELVFRKIFLPFWLMRSQAKQWLLKSGMSFVMSREQTIFFEKSVVNYHLKRFSRLVNPDFDDPSEHDVERFKSSFLEKELLHGGNVHIFDNKHKSYWYFRYRQSKMREAREMIYEKMKSLYVVCKNTDFKTHSWMFKFRRAGRGTSKQCFTNSSKILTSEVLFEFRKQFHVVLNLQKQEHEEFLDNLVFRRIFIHYLLRFSEKTEREFLRRLQVFFGEWVLVEAFFSRHLQLFDAIKRKKWLRDYLLRHDVQWILPIQN